tara:strand:- start:330 stop:503 length:174 start_codon:yes stop_codon:yes gene_type:complete
MPIYTKKENAIIRQVKNGLSTDAIIGMFLNKQSSNADEIVDIIKKYIWEQRKKGNRV